MTPSGTVSIVDQTSGSTLATGTLDANGNAQVTWTAVAGTYELVAKYSGDVNFEPGESTPQAYTVNVVQQKVTVNLTVTPPSPVNAGTGVTFDVGVVPQA